MSDCIFCRIVKKELPAQVIYEDEHMLAFNDKFPQAPVHVLLVPKKHVPTLWDIDPQDTDLVNALFKAMQEVGRKVDPEKRGFRLVNNCGAGAQQTVLHVHFHFLAGRFLRWPPG